MHHGRLQQLVQNNAKTALLLSCWQLASHGMTYS
jgi:hypothetical protein